MAITPSPTTTQTGTGGSITVRYLQYTVHLPKVVSYAKDYANTWTLFFDLFKKNISSDGTITWSYVDHNPTTMPGYEADGTLLWRNTYITTTLDDTDEIQTNILVGTFRVKAKYQHNVQPSLYFVNENQVKYSKEFTYYR